MIRRGRISVNGETVSPPGVEIDSDRDVVAVDGKIVKPGAEFVYYAVNKPEGYLSTVKDPHGGHTILELVPGDVRVYPVGRLDKDSCGLMILTNDGELTHLMTHPSFLHEKEYEVSCRWEAPVPVGEGRRLIKSMENGIRLEDGLTAPAAVRLKQLDSSHAIFTITLKEGRKRQIRRMCRELGLKVETLRRIRMGKLRLGSLTPGSYRKVSREDIL